MPKEVLDLRSFSGGLNNKTNPRDLEQDEFQTLQGFSLETPGKLKVSGAVADLPHVSSADEEKFTTTLNHGNGLFYHRSERDPADAALADTELLLINDIANTKVKVFDKTDGAYESGSEIDYGSTGTTVDYYSVDGEVRVSANDQDNTNNQNKWYGYINNSLHYGNDDVNVHLIKSTNSFKVDNSYPAPLKSGTQSTPDGYGYPQDALQEYTVGNSDYYPATSNQSEFLFNHSYAAWTATSGAIEPAGANKIDTIADQLKGSTYDGYTDGYGPLAMWMWFAVETDTSDDTNANITVYKNTSNKKYSIWVSNVYGDQESNTTHVGYIQQPVLTADTKKTLYWSVMGRVPKKLRQTGFKVYWAIDDDDVVDQQYLFLEIDFTKGIRKPGSDVWVKMGQVTHNNSGAIGVDHERMYATGNAFTTADAAIQKILGSSNIQTLDTTEPYNNSAFNPMGRAGTWFKTSVILNRRAYVGNVRYYDENNKLQRANDTVFKSEVNKFDTFNNEGGRLDVEINDGDEIIKLASVGSKLLEFKRNTLFVINCSRDIEQLEATLKYKGCEKDYHVVQAEGFVAWINKYGAFLYDGESLRDLLIGQNGQKRIDDWGTNYYSDDAVIGYVPDKQTLLILNPAIGEAGGNPSGGVLEIDLKTLGWAYSAAKGNAVDISNLVNLNDGKLIWFEKDSNDIELKYWNPEPTLNGANTVLSLKTPAFTFGNPSQDKGITTVYISYKNGEDMTLKGFTDVGTDGNGDSDGSTFNSVTLGTLAGNSDNSNRTAKFKIRGITTAFKKVKTFGLELSGTTDQQDFELNDMQITYRTKSLK